MKSKDEQSVNKRRGILKCQTYVAIREFLVTKKAVPGVK